MIKKLSIVLFCIFSLQMNGQEGTASPYSFYGIGSLKFKGTVENRSMGGLSFVNDSIHINLRNPSSYVGPDLTSAGFNEDGRLTKFSVAGSYNDLTLENETTSEKANTTTFDYLALSFPAGKFGFGLGLLPYTAVGYRLEADRNNDELVENRYNGEGGLNKAFVGVGYKITDNLSVGVDFSYNFGNTVNSVIEFLYDDEGELVQYQTRETNRSDLSGINTNFGLNYTRMLNDRLQLMSGITYAPKSNLTSNNSRTFSTIIYVPNTGQEIEQSTIDADLDAQNLEKTDLSLPSRLTLGAGLGQPRKWFLGAEFTSEKTSEFSNPIVSFENANFVDATGIALGGFFVPDYNSFSSYWKRVTYRAGIKAQHTGLSINGEDIREFGISFGVGLPVGLYYSSANIGFEIGSRGTTNQNLIKENFFSLRISLSLADRWFQKLKYD